MVKTEGITIAGGYAILEFIQSFGQDGGAIAPEQLTELLKYINLPTVFVIGAILWFFRKEKEEKSEKKEFVCPYYRTSELPPMPEVKADL